MAPARAWLSAMVCLTVMGSASAFVGGGPALLRAGQVRVSCVQGRPANAVAMQAQGEDEATSGKSQLEVLEGYGYNVIDVIGMQAVKKPAPVAAAAAAPSAASPSQPAAAAEEGKAEAAVAAPAAKAGTQDPPPAKLEWPKAKLEAKAVNEKQWISPAPDAVDAPAAAAPAPPAAAAPKEGEAEAAAPAAAAGTNKYKEFEENWSPPEPAPLIVPEEVVKQLLTALKNNNKPQPNAGLSTVLKFSSPSNPITQREPEFFFGMMQNSQYSLLLGKFDTFQIVGTEDLSNTGAGLPGQETVAVEVLLLSGTQTMMDAGVDFNFMDSTGKGQSSVSLKWQLSKDKDTECWLSDTLFFVPVAKKGKTMDELTSDTSAKENARFTGTPASQKLKAQKELKTLVVEPNAFAQTALKMNLLKPKSPLLSTGMVGNKGLDPLGFASSPDLLLQYREAELKHARLAMLAAVGWIASEVVHTPLANLFGKDSLLQEGADSVAEKVPTVLNGGLEAIQPMFWVSFFLFAGVAETWRLLTISENPMNFTPGAIGFDPLELYKKEDAKGQAALQLKEVNNGRLAMLAVAYFAVSEKFGDSAIINSIPFLPKTGNILEEVAEEIANPKLINSIPFKELMESLWI